MLSFEVKYVQPEKLMPFSSKYTPIRLMHCLKRAVKKAWVSCERLRRAEGTLGVLWLSLADGFQHSQWAERAQW